MFLPQTATRICVLWLNTIGKMLLPRFTLLTQITITCIMTDPFSRENGRTSVNQVIFLWHHWWWVQWYYSVSGSLAMYACSSAASQRFSVISADISGDIFTVFCGCYTVFCCFQYMLILVSGCITLLFRTWSLCVGMQFSFGHCSQHHCITSNIHSNSPKWPTRLSKTHNPNTLKWL